MFLHHRRLAFASSTGIAIFAASALTSALLEGCAHEDAKQVVLKTEIEAADGIEAAFTNVYGWSIVLDKVAVSVGPMYYFGTQTTASATQWLGIPNAYAHPGHGPEGNAIGEMLSPASVDLTMGATPLGEGIGFTGTYTTATFTFEPTPVGMAKDILGTHVVVVEGQATKNSMNRFFRAEIDASDVFDAIGDPHIYDCTFRIAAAVRTTGTIKVRVSPTIWLKDAQFDDFADGTASEPTLIGRDTAAFAAIVTGVRSPSAYSFGYGEAP